MLEVTGQAITLMAIIGLGHALKRFGVLRPGDFRVIATIVLKVTLPCVLVTGFATIDFRGSLLFLTALGFGTTAIGAASGYWLQRRGGKKERAFGVLNLGGYNIGAFAMPYLQGLLGPAEVVRAAMFDVGNSLGNVGLNYGWATTIVSPHRVSVLAFIRRVLANIIFDTYVILLVMAIFHIPIPSFVLGFAGTVGAANTPLAMLMIGVGLELALPRAKLGMVAVFLAARVLLAMIFTLLTWFWLPLPHDYAVVLCMLFWAPIASMVPGFTLEVGGDVAASAFLNSATIVLAVVAMPVVLAVLT